MSEAESKARPHGDMPQAFRDYWARGAGAAKIRWGAPDDYYRCVAELGKYVSPGEVHGVCGNLHEIATGMSTAEHEKLLKGQGKDHPMTAGDAVNASHKGRK